jgi:hypothetical protein
MIKVSPRGKDSASRAVADTLAARLTDLYQQQSSPTRPLPAIYANSRRSDEQRRSCKADIPFANLSGPQGTWNDAPPGRVPTVLWAEHRQRRYTHRARLLVIELLLSGPQVLCIASGGLGPVVN